MRRLIARDLGYDKQEEEESATDDERSPEEHALYESIRVPIPFFYKYGNAFEWIMTSNPTSKYEVFIRESEWYFVLASALIMTAAE